MAFISGNGEGRNVVDGQKGDYVEIQSTQLLFLQCSVETTTSKKNVKVQRESFQK